MVQLNPAGITHAAGVNTCKVPVKPTLSNIAIASLRCKNGMDSWRGQPACCELILQHASLHAQRSGACLRTHRPQERL
jgi:hypothetical protein